LQKKQNAFADEIIVRADTLNQQQRKVQEAKFEIITSEASYVKSLGILARHFVQCPDLQDESVLSKTDKDILFSNIMPGKMQLFLLN
jgi:hypothetical protein